MPTFADRGVSRGQHGGNPTAANLSFLDRTEISVRGGSAVLTTGTKFRR
jgi:hypothetical protein